jgi:16S rRNA (cytosine1402-N4)-methyltransferase
MAEPSHIPVLMDEVIATLAPRVGETYVDCTAGLGGHAAAIAARLGPTGRVVLFDLDADNLRRATEKVRAVPDGPEVVAHHAGFAHAPRLLVGAGLSADLVLADLGFASPQVDNPERGFSFSRDGPLDMRLNPEAPISAAELVNTLPELELAEIIRDLGEEPWPMARRVASKIASVRAAGPISRTAELASIVRSALPPRKPGPSIDPATRTFQALRIAVNDELGSLRSLLSAVERAAAGLAGQGERGGGGEAGGVRSWLQAGARVGVISFHSLEDRPVKQSMAGLVGRGLADHLTRKAVVAEEPEVQSNPRARSAKFRAVRLSAVSGRG